MTLSTAEEISALKATHEKRDREIQQELEKAKKAIHDLKEDVNVLTKYELKDPSKTIEKRLEMIEEWEKKKRKIEV